MEETATQEVAVAETTAEDNDEVDAAVEEVPQPPQDAPAPPALRQVKVYDRSKLQPTLQKGELARSHYAVHHLFGLDVARRANLALLDSHVVAFVAGNAVVLLDLKTLKKKYIFGIDGRGIGCLAVHPSRTLLAVGDKGNDPSIYIYSYPELKIVRVLRKGTERTFAALAFDSTGEKLASLGGAPDYLLTVWNWDSEAVVLHAKAFGQDIYTVAFSPDDPGKLVTSGTGHIRFWKMASTFTGLKLQGDIGKFGKVELSDIEAFAMLPDGKVLTSTESGALLVWEGNFIKLRVVRRRGRPCHEGAIFVVILERKEGRFVTAGQDGWVRWWDFSALDAAEVDSDKSIDFELEPTEEVFVGERVCVRHMVRWQDPADAARDFYLLQDAGGAVWTLDPSTRKTSALLSVPGGALGGMDAAPSTHFAATTGADGTLRLWDYVARRQLFSARFDTPGHCVRWAPLGACPKGRTVAVGFEDGVVRVLYRLPDKWKRLCSFKPHSQPVTVMEYSRDGKLLATGSPDGTLFLLRVPPTPEAEGEYTPVGFIDLKSPVTSVAWAEGDKALLFTLGNGGVGEVDLSSPTALDVDTSKSFEITSLPTRRFAFKPKPTLHKNASASEAAVEGAEASKADEKTPGAPGEEEEDDEEEDAGFAALQARYSPTTPGRFLLTLSGRLAGVVYECAFDSEYPLAEHPVGNGPRALQEENARLPEVVTMRVSPSGELLLTGGNDGAMGVRPLATPGFFTRMPHHDGDRGQVVAVAASFDEAFLLSAGADGLLLVYNYGKGPAVAEAQARAAVMAKEAPIGEVRDPEHVFVKEDAEEGSNEVLPGFVKAESSTKAPCETEPDGVAQKVEGGDISDAATYSIQDAKLKTEEDNMRRLAELKKADKRKQVEQLREELAAIVAENAEQPPERRLEDDEFVIDKEFQALLKQQGAALCEEVRREREYDSELAAVRLEKVLTFFLGNVEVEALEVTGIRAAGVKVACFRTTKLSPETQAMLREIHDMINTQRGDPSQTEGDARLRTAASLSERDGTIGNNHDLNEGLGAGGELHKVSTFEARKKMRQARKQQMQALLSEKPKEDAADPRDVEAIVLAEKHMGDFKLKSAPNYEVPDDQRMNAEKKLRQMVLVEESMYSIRMRFNRRLLGLRQKKLEILRSVKDANQRIKEIDAELAQPEASKQTWEPGVSLSEWPECRSLYSEQELADFAAEVKAKGLANARPKRSAVLPKETSPLERALDGAPEDKQDERKAAVEAAYVDVARLRVGKAMSEVLVSADSKALSEKQELARQHREMSLRFERQSLIDNMHAAIGKFDEALLRLRREKIVFMADLKAAELKMLVLAQELALLRNFEAKDTALVSKLTKAQSEKAEVVAAIGDCQQRLASKKKEVEAWQARDVALQKEFSNTVPLSSPFHPTLLKIFKRKIKRNKKKEENGGADAEDEEDEEEEDEDDDDFEDDDLDEDEEGVDDSCPAGCDALIHHKVLALREARLDQEETLQEINKNIDELKRTNDRHVQRQKQIDKDLLQTSKEIRAFQTEKQLALNQLDVTVPLTIKQIHCLSYHTTPEGQIPRTLVADALLGTHVLMSKRDLQALDQRTRELEDEIRAEKHRFKALHKERIQLEKEKAAKEADITVAKARCTELQMLKFGQLIDLESLDEVSVDDSEKELKHKIDAIDNKGEKEVRDQSRHYEKLRQQLLDATNGNTALLSEVADLNSRQLLMEKSLRGGNKHMPIGDTSPIVKLEIEERNRLLGLVELQAKELDVLKAEINLLRRKGAPLYSTVVVEQK